MTFDLSRYTSPRFLVLALGTLVLSSTLWTAPAEAEPEADRVYGQPDFTSQYPGNPQIPLSARLVKPKGVAVSKDGVYISDEAYNRILFFPHGKTDATRVYGQADFNSTLQNYRGLSADSLSMPVLFDVSEAGLAVADWRNGRALFYPSGQTTASVVYGQPHDHSTVPQYTYNPFLALKYPFGATVDREGGVYVSDSMDLRVVYYPPGSNVASRVYGGTGTGAGTNAYFGFLQGLAVDDSGLYVADTQNNRVVFFPNGSMRATRVYGQPDFVGSLPNNGGISASTLNQPSDIALDSEGVYIADSGNRRVLYYPGTSTTASVVYGQPDFRTTFYAVSATRMGAPWSVAADDTALYVTDLSASRVLRFPKQGVPVANRLAFTQAPSGSVEGTPLPTQPVVNVLQADGTVATGYNGPVILSLVSANGPSCAQLRGTTTVDAVEGVATFSGLWIDSDGIYRMEAQAGTLTGAQTEEITVTESTAPSAAAGDLDHSGTVDIVDTVFALRVLMGLDTFPNGV